MMMSCFIKGDDSVWLQPISRDGQHTQSQKSWRETGKQCVLPVSLTPAEGLKSPAPSFLKEMLHERGAAAAAFESLREESMQLLLLCPSLAVLVSTTLCKRSPCVRNLLCWRVCVGESSLPLSVSVIIFFPASSKSSKENSAGGVLSILFPTEGVFMPGRPRVRPPFLSLVIG